VIKKLKIAISTDSGRVSAHFGRAPEFTFVTIENNDVIEKIILPNPGHTVGSIPLFIRENGASHMITGGMGHRAQGFFQQYNIEVITGVQGDVNDVIKSVLNGTLEGGESLCAPGEGKGYGVEKIHTDADDDYHREHHSHSS